MAPVRAPWLPAIVHRYLRLQIKSHPVRVSVVRPDSRARELSSSSVSNIQCRRVMYDTAKNITGSYLKPAVHL